MCDFQFEIEEDNFQFEIEEDDLAAMVASRGKAVTLYDIDSNATKVVTLPWPIRSHIDESPVSGSWALPTLYQTDQTNNKRYWQIGFDETTGKRHTVSGCVGTDKPTTSDRLVEPKGGKTIQQQAWQDVTRKYILKWRTGCRVPTEVTEPSIPMQLANEYTNPNLYAGYEKTTKLNFPVLISPKLDGVRGRVYLTIDGPRIFSRGAKEFNREFYSKHLNEISNLFAYLPAGIGLDGELFTSEIEFDTLRGAIVASENRNPKLDLVQFWIFDLTIAEVPSETRYQMLLNAYNSYLTDGGTTQYFRIVAQFEVNSHEDIINYHKMYVAQKYEGACIRHTGKANPKNLKKSYYLGKRNANWLKVKKFQDDEFEVIGVEEAKGKRRGTAIFVLRTKDGKEFRCNPSGTDADRKYWYDHPELCIGRMYTVKFFGYTSTGLPRIATGKAFRDTPANPGIASY